MKKVFLSISAMLCTVAVSYAQTGPGPVTTANSSIVGQTGNKQNAEVIQKGTGQMSKIKQATSDNDAYVLQGTKPGLVTISAKNSADIDQLGTKNWAKISQNNWDNTATQKQVGDNNKATIWQDEVAFNWPNLVGGDTATQTQTGNKNEATIDQGTTGNNPIPTVAVFPKMVALTASIPKNPHGLNKATQTQNGDYNKAYTSQGGMNNESMINQDSRGYAATATYRNVANHYQYGEGNKATTTQLGFKNLDNILQEGNMNISVTKQTGTSAGNMNAVSQQGNNNNSSVTQRN
jgi:hypothetical protein